MKRKIEKKMGKHSVMLQEMKMYLGKRCLHIRTQNKLSREYVNYMSGVSDKSIAKIEYLYKPSIDLASMLFYYYVREGYATHEEWEQSCIEIFVRC